MAAWDPNTQRLIDYLAKPFSRKVGGQLWTLLSTVGRELSNATESVTLTNDTDVRGDGTFIIHTRHDTITAVSSVKRVDGSGATLETYTVVGFDNRSITLTGTKAPDKGDRLQVTYTYQFSGLEYRIRQALLQLNILTASGDFLDSWGRWFAVPRLVSGKYGTFKYGQGKYGTTGLEGDTQYSRRIIDKITQHRNTKPTILAAVQRVTGGSPYMVEWFDAVTQAWIFAPDPSHSWQGEADTSKHLIWGQTARFVNAAVPGGGPCVAEIWVPPNPNISTGQILGVANQYKAAGIRLFIRYQMVVAPPPEAPSGLMVSE